MADPASPPPSKLGRLLKPIFGGGVAMVTGAVAMYSQTAFDQLVKPSKPLANFTVAGTDGLKATFDNKAVGQSGWWDFGDGTALEPFEVDKPTAEHVYPKPGKYSAKLIVRNFMLEEANRSIEVDLSNPPSTLPPTLKAMKIESIKDSAPATYRISGEVADADEVVWRLGDKGEHAVATAGPFERYVTFETPGTYPIVVTALSKSKAKPDTYVETVSVKGTRVATYDAMVTFADSAAKVERGIRTERVPCPLMEKGVATKGFDRTVTAKPGSTFADVKVDPRGTEKTVKNAKVEIAADKKTARVTGEWALTGDQLVKAAGGSDVTVTLVITEERGSTVAGTKDRLVAATDATGAIQVRVPPQLRPGAGTRTVEVDVGISQPNAPRISLAKGTLDATGKWSAPVQVNGKSATVSAEIVNNMVRVTFK